MFDQFSVCLQYARIILQTGEVVLVALKESYFLIKCGF